MKSSIFGLGYVGCVTAGCLAKDGHDVIGVDIAPGKVEKLAAGRPTVVESGLERLIAEGHRESASGRRRTVGGGTGQRASINCVGTPPVRTARWISRRFVKRPS